MAATTSFTTRCPVAYGRSGYNKDGSNDDEEDNKFVNFGRSGYNKDDKDDDDEDKKTSSN
ncbi:hypothetical protein B0H66DRAFT_600438 [Apodospora peruviana]|uniref:Uncharacterized protein n=1 Tax=Apodospora peruviana TaxID=516989 RepID=A0AAE0IKA2_9PEZI|nr:hypothetical protein B0H66DRAFT_600438 [Apodospora peruviana]